LGRGASSGLLANIVARIDACELLGRSKAPSGGAVGCGGDPVLFYPSRRALS